MYILVLKFSDNKAQASDFMQEHNQWIKQGFDDGIFLLVGSLKPGLGGVILVAEHSLQSLQKRISEDPFVKQKVVTAEVLTVEPKKAHQSLQFLVGD